ncbi:hypothetical protein J6I39_04520 [bacterium]|nr:hypothetical protein [bacterium]
MRREDIDNLENKYMKLHFLMEIMQQIIDARLSCYENSDICCLYSEIMNKRDNFYEYFKKFIIQILQNDV